MQFVSQSRFSTLALNKIFQDIVSLHHLHRFPANRENVTLVIGEHKLVVDAVIALLVSCLEATKEKYQCH
jgi:hypothetical protein